MAFRRGRTPESTSPPARIVDSKGLVLSNAHVAGGAKSVTLKFSDGREFRELSRLFLIH